MQQLGEVRVGTEGVRKRLQLWGDGVGSHPEFGPVLSVAQEAKKSYHIGSGYVSCAQKERFVLEINIWDLCAGAGI